MTLGCKTPAQEHQDNKGELNATGSVREINQGMALPPGKEREERGQLAPNTCRILGKIVNISDDLDTNKATPCGKTPCKALVQVVRVLGYGAGFGTLAEGSKVETHFSFTLHHTADFFPELTNPLPGLKEGDVFQADISRMTEGTSSGSAFLVTSYIKK